jgi:DNA-binding CsgD family transcriptional regulator
MAEVTGGSSTSQGNGERPTRLTPRQTEVVRLAAVGMSAQATAHKLGISKNTVNEYLEAARKRAGVTSKSQLVAWAVAVGVVAYE